MEPLRQHEPIANADSSGGESHEELPATTAASPIEALSPVQIIATSPNTATTSGDAVFDQEGAANNDKAAGSPFMRRASCDEDGMVSTYNDSMTSAPHTPTGTTVPHEYHFSFHNVPDWMEKPHFRYRRILHDYFANLHMYNPKWLPRGSSIAAGCNVMACSWSIGTLTMPFAAWKSGLVYFAVITLLTMSLTVATQYLVCRAVDITKLHSFEMLCRRVCGSRKPEIVVELLIMVSCFGVTIASIVIVGDVAEGIVAGMITDDPDAMSMRWVRVLSQITVYVLFMLPLSLMRTMRALQFASAVSLLAMGVVSAYTVVDGFQHASNENLAPTGVTSYYDFSTGTSLLFFSYCNQLNTIEIYSEMENRTPGAFCKITFVTMGSVAVVFLLVGYAGLAQYGDAAEGNILNSITCDGAFPLIAMLGVALKVTLSFALVVFPTREAVLHLVGVDESSTVSRAKFTASTVAITAVALIIAIFLPGIVALLGLVGSLCVGAFAFVLPAGIVWMLPEYWAPLDGSTWGRYAPLHVAALLFCVVFGTSMGISGTVASIHQFLN